MFYLHIFISLPKYMPPAKENLVVGVVEQSNYIPILENPSIN
jgi:hypothetical protein